MSWNRKQIRKNAWAIAFHRGFKAWFSLMLVCLFFALIGVSGTTQISVLSEVDRVIGLETSVLADNVTVLENYIVGSKLTESIPFLTDEMAITFIDTISKSSTWLIHLLGANFAYFNRNSGAIIVALSISALINFLVQFFLQSAAVIGKNRYALENRYSMHVHASRVAAPFHRKNLMNLVGAMFMCKLAIVLWSFTIIGGFYKMYQYRFVPYLLAENPSLKWKQARQISSEMTKGYKWKLFLTDLSCLPIELLRLVPFLGIAIVVPFETEYIAEQYITLRSRQLSRQEIFIERAFDRAAVTQDDSAETPVYLLQSMALELPDELHTKNEYNLMEYLYMFFLFAFTGWIWEVTLYIVRDHMLVNRGTMYGPWLPIYGVGGVAIIFILDRFKANKPKFFGLSILICGILEFFTSWILDFVFNSQYWDYKDSILNVNGRICLSGLLLFAFGGMAGVYIIAPKLSAFLKEHNKKREIVLCVILCVAFVIDLICCAIFGLNSGAGVGLEL